MKLNIGYAALMAALPAAVSGWKLETSSGTYEGPNEKFSGCRAALFSGSITVSDLKPGCFFLAFGGPGCTGVVESYITQNTTTIAGPSQSFSVNCN